MKKRWIFKPEPDPVVVAALTKDLGVESTIAQLLVQRGINNFEDAKAFFRPELSKLHDPFLFNDMDKAVERIEKAFNKGEKILVYGDYDVDGTTAVALVYSFFVENGFSNIDFYIPDRYSEGYGISYDSIDFAAKNDFTLFIALDCGIKAAEKIAYATQKGIDFIICDHHRPGDVLPAAVAVLDAKRPDSTYPYDELSGCGVGFKLIQAYASKNNIAFDSLVKYLDLVTISIASDLVPVTGENRILAYYGLKIINNSPRPAIEAIFKLANIVRKTPSAEQTQNYEADALIFDKELNINDLVFVIGPRINAAGRIESGCNAVKLLIAPDLESANVVAKQINDFNIERRSLDTFITQEALTMIAHNERLGTKKSTVIFNSSWHKGVIGIVASRLTEVYYRPTIVLTQSNGLITGSARSVKDFDIYDAVDACSDLLEHFGGHMYAAGLSLKPENKDKFIDKFEKIVEKTINPKMLVPEIEIDCKLNFDQITPKFLRILKQFAPFGPGNMSPVFYADNVRDTGYARIVGKNHLKMTVFQDSVRSSPYSAIAFQQGDKFVGIQKTKSMEICYHIDENEWNGNKSVQLNIKDLRFENPD